MEPVYMLGFKLAELTQQPDAACVGLLYLAIKDAGKTKEQMGYGDYQTVIRNYLPRRLNKMQIADSQKVTDELLMMLKKKQSIFSMAAR